MPRVSAKNFFLGIAITAALGAVISRTVLTIHANELPDDFSYQALLTSQDNLFDKERNQFSGAQTSRSDFSYTTTKVDGNVLLINNTFDVTTLGGEDIVHVDRTYAINKRDRSHTSYPGVSTRQGYLFAPKNLRLGQAYDYWHVNYNQQLHMQFEGEDSILGVKVYRYHSAFTVDQTAELSHLEGVPEDYSMKLNVQLTTWVEPVTGRLIRYSDAAEASYYDKKTGELVLPWNNFSNSFNQPSVEEQVRLAKQDLERINFYSNMLPLFLLFVTAVALFIAFGSIGSFLNNIHYQVLFAGLLITVFITITAAENYQFQQQLVFDRQTAKLEESIMSRLKFYDDTLHAAQGLVQASKQVTKEDWRLFSANINLRNRLPGILGVGYSVKVGGQDKIEAFEEKLKQELGDPSFHVWPKTQRDEYHAITYLEPLDEMNQRAIGFDMFQESTRQRAMSKARDSGNTVLSDAVKLVQEQPTSARKGFLMYLPQYDTASSASTVEERRAALTGFVYSPFRGTDFMESIVAEIGSDLQFIVYAGEKSPENELYRNNTQDQASVRQSRVRQFSSQWTIDYFPSPGLYKELTNSVVSTVILGLTFTLLTSGVTWLLVNSGKRTRRLVHQKVAELKLSEARAVEEAAASQKARAQLEKSQKVLVAQNELLENSKIAMFNILDDLADEKNVQAETIAKDEAILHGIGDGLVTTDVAGLITLINPKFSELTGWDFNEIEGKPLTKLLPLLDEAGNPNKDYQDRIARTIREHTTDTISTAENIYFRRKDGSLFPVSIASSPITQANKVIGVVIVFHDVTREKEVDRAKSEFVSLASHQLRTPLTAINWYTDMLLAGDAGKLNEEQGKYLSEIQLGNQRMVDLVNALLNVSRIELGTFMIEPTKDDLIRLCKDIVRDNEPMIFERQINFKEKYDQLPKVMIDAKLMRIVIENLVSNAVKYTPKKGSVLLSVTKRPDHIELKVKDTGYGIPLSQQEKIFGKLFRADNVKEHDTEGTGLGLYIARSVIESAGGKIWFESKENKGTTFFVTLPLVGMKPREGSRQLD